MWLFLVSPEIIPEKMNISTDARQMVFLSCNATGNPEPMISWVKVPNTQITPNEKYQLLGTSLAIRNVLPGNTSLRQQFEQERKSPSIQFSYFLLSSCLIHIICESAIKESWEYPSKVWFSEDEGFYHCIAKSDAGQVLAQRRLIVNS